MPSLYHPQKSTKIQVPAYSSRSAVNLWKLSKNRVDLHFTEVVSPKETVMDVRRVDGSYDSYKLTVNSSELRTVHTALMGSSGAEADTMLHALDWYVERLPKPGEDKEDAKEREEREEQTNVDEIDVDVDLEQPSPDADLDAEADALIAAEPEGEALPTGDDLDAEVDALVPAPPAG